MCNSLLSHCIVSDFLSNGYITKAFQTASAWIYDQNVFSARKHFSASHSAWADNWTRHLRGYCCRKTAHRFTFFTAERVPSLLSAVKRKLTCRQGCAAGGAPADAALKLESWLKDDKRQRQLSTPHRRSWPVLPKSDLFCKNKHNLADICVF